MLPWGSHHPGVQEGEESPRPSLATEQLCQGGLSFREGSACATGSWLVLGLCLLLGVCNEPSLAVAQPLCRTSAPILWCVTVSPCPPPCLALLFSAIVDWFWEPWILPGLCQLPRAGSGVGHLCVLSGGGEAGG